MNDGMAQGSTATIRGLPTVDLNDPALLDLLRDLFGQPANSTVRVAVFVYQGDPAAPTTGAVSPVRVSAPVADGWEKLTAREVSIAELVGQGLSNRQIASRVYLSPHTVNYHLRSIFQKLSISSRVLLGQLARTHLT